MTNHAEVAPAEPGGASWYEIVEGPMLEQGDLLTNLLAPRVVVDTNAPTGYRILVGRGNYIVLSQTCDLDNEKIPEVLLADVRTYQDVASDEQYARSTAFRKALIQGSDISYFLLHEFTGPPSLEWALINFHYLRLVDAAYCKKHAVELGKRLRLVPPYKEHLAQSFSRYISRVALPQTAHSFKDVAYQPPEKPSPS